MSYHATEALSIDVSRDGQRRDAEVHTSEAVEHYSRARGGVPAVNQGGSNENENWFEEEDGDKCLIGILNKC